MKTFIILTCLFSFNATARILEEVNVEHQVRLCDDENEIIKKLNLNQFQDYDLKKREFKTFYIETKNRDYEAINWSIRIRVKSNKTEITLKKKSVEGQHLEARYSGMECEFDLHGTKKEYSCKLSADIKTENFLKVLNNKKNWLDILDSTQYNFLKDNNALFENAVIYGTMINQRIQWEDDLFGTITLDLIHQSQYNQNTFHEISIRYPEGQGPEIGIKFEHFIQSNNLKFCSDQIDRPVNKFDLLQILN